MKKLIEKATKILVSAYWYLFLNQAIKILEKKNNMSQQELTTLLRSLITKTESIVFQKRKYSYDGTINSSSEAYLPIDGCLTEDFGTKPIKTFKNVIELLIGEESEDGPLPDNFEYFYLKAVGDTIRTIRNQFSRTAYANDHKEGWRLREQKMRVAHVRFSVADGGMNVVTIQHLEWFSVSSGQAWFGVEEEYIIKWAETKTP